MPEYIVLPDNYFMSSVADLPLASRLAWIAVLFEAQRNKGQVRLSPGVLARMARITTSEAADALAAFRAVDPYSENPAYGGRRLIPREEGWEEVVSWQEYVKIRSRYFARLRQRRYRQAEEAQ